MAKKTASSKSKTTKAKRTPARIPTPRLLISGDAAAAAAIALYVDGKLVAHTVADGTRFKTLWQALHPLLEPYKHIPNNERYGIIEEGFISFHSVKGSLTLGRRRGLMQACFEVGGVSDFEFVPAATWQAWAFDHKKVTDTKAASIACVKRWYGIDVSTDDEADAICMATYFMQERCLQI